MAGILRNILLVFDIGNTTVSYGLFRERKLLRQGRIPTKAKAYLWYLSPLPWGRIKAALIASVVPDSLRRLKRELQKRFPQRIFVFPPDYSPLLGCFIKAV